MVFHAIKAGEGDTFLVGGSERTSRLDSERGTTRSDAIPMMPNPVLQESWELFIPMGMTAENVADKYNVSREDMDKFSQRSQERAVAAQESGFFDREIVPFTKEDGTVVSKDDGPRASSTYEKLAELKPVFRPDGGRVTAGNACPLNDGAAALVVMSEEKANALGIKPLARIIASGVSGLDPRIMGVGPIEAVRKCLAQANMKIGDVDVVELNEAFAAQVLPVCENIGVDPFSDKFNPNGGAIALGHPFGQTGARIMTTLLNDLATADKTIGLETMCVGGGQGLAMIVERLN
jgi:acetyl-CoA C-acetyltransferase